jgi:hypothetical protein
MPFHTVTVIGVTTQQTFPAGQTVGAITASLIGGAPQTTTTLPLDSTLKAVFANVADGSYTVQLQATDGAGNPLGAPYNTPSFVVSDPGVVVNIPTGGTVTVV